MCYRAISFDILIHGGSNLFLDTLNFLGDSVILQKVQ